MNNMQKNPKAKQSKSVTKQRGTKDAAPSSTTGVKPTIASLIAQQDPAAKERGVTIPVNQLVLEATRLYPEGNKLADRFAKLPTFEMHHLTHLPLLAEALSEAETAWNTANSDKKSKSISPLRPQAEKLRSDIVADGRYLLRNDPKAQLALDDLSHGKSISDLAADLRKLTVFVKTYGKVLLADGSRPSDLGDKAAALADKLLKGSEGASAADALAYRNQVYHLLQDAVDQVRAGARYILRDDPKRLAPFLSRYNAVKTKSAKKDKTGGDAPVTPTAPATAQPAPEATAGDSKKK